MIEDIEVEVSEYAKFINPRNGVHYAFLEMPIENLQTLVPKGAKWGSKNEVYDDEGELISYDQKNVEEFIMQRRDSLDGTKTVINLAAKERPTLRQKGVTQSDLEDWNAYAEAVWGLGIDHWMTIPEFQALITSEEYNDTEEQIQFTENGTLSDKQLDIYRTQEIMNQKLNYSVEQVDEACAEQLEGKESIDEGWDDITGSLIARRLDSTAGKLNYNHDENTITMQSGGSITNTADRLMFNFQKLHKIKTNGVFRLHTHWEQTSTDKIEWTIQYRKQSNGAQKTTPWITVYANSDDDSVWVYSSGTLNNITKLVEVDLSDVSISGTVQFRLARTDSTGTDIEATFVDAHYNTDQARGSIDEFEKTPQCQ